MGLVRRKPGAHGSSVRADLELVTGFLVDVGTTQDRELLDLVGQRDRPAHRGTGPLGGAHDLLRAGIQHAVVERLQADPDILALNCHLSFSL